MVRVTPMFDQAPGGAVELPLKCTSGWSVTGPATLAADGRSIAIAPDAPPGAAVGVAFEHAGKPVSTRFLVVARDAVVLTGRRSQQALAGCTVAEPVGELEFAPQNRFAVTFRPFESYKDYWGRYSFDPATGAIALTVEDGNFIPPGLDLEGRARLSGGRLILEGMFLGSRQDPPRQGCVYTF